MPLRLAVSHGRVDLKIELVRVLILDPRLEQLLDIGRGGTIAHRRLLTIKLHRQIVKLKSGKSSQDMLNRVNFRFPALQRGSPGNINNMVDIGDYSGLSGQVSPYESDTRVRLGRLEGHGTVGAGVQADSGYRDFFLDRSLFFVHKP